MLLTALNMVMSVKLCIIITGHVHCNMYCTANNQRWYEGEELSRIEAKCKKIFNITVHEAKTSIQQ